MCVITAYYLAVQVFSNKMDWLTLCPIFSFRKKTATFLVWFWLSLKIRCMLLLTYPKSICIVLSLIPLQANKPTLIGIDARTWFLVALLLFLLIRYYYVLIFPGDFWSGLGGKKEYQTSKSLQNVVNPPRLFGCSNKSGRLSVSHYATDVDHFI